MQKVADPMTTDPDTISEKDIETPPRKQAVASTLVKRIGRFFRNMPDGELVTPTAEPVALRANGRIAWGSPPFKLTLGDVALEVHPDLAITGDERDGVRDWIVHAGPAYYQSAPGFVRVDAGDTVLFGRSDDVQKAIFGYDKSVASRHVRISNHRGALTIQPLEFERSTTISTIEPVTPVWRSRRENLMRLPGILGRPLTQFDDEEALDIVRDVNELVATEVYRELNDDGVPGGIIRFPDDMTVVIMGDIHAQVDNILQVITTGGLLADLVRGEACLVFLGDLVHSQETDELESMDSSVFILDLFFMLKRRFPENVFYFRGNHESFSRNVGKAGVPQGILLRQHLEARRGKDFLAEMEKLFNGLAFVAQGKRFAACHGAPVRSKADRDTLVNIQRFPGLQNELVWSRLRNPGRPTGYTKGSVKRFRKTLNLPKHAPLIVGHTPLSEEDTLWLDAGNIKGHHIVYSAHRHRIAALVMRDGRATPLEFIPEPMLAIVNAGPDR